MLHNQANISNLGFEVNSPAPVSIKSTQDIDDDMQSDDPILLSSQEATNQKDTKENVAPFIESAPSKPNSGNSHFSLMLMDLLSIVY